MLETLENQGFSEVFKRYENGVLARNIGVACNFIKKETLAQEFSCEFCKIVQNTYFVEHLRPAVSGTSNHLWKNHKIVTLSR